MPKKNVLLTALTTLATVLGMQTANAEAPVAVTQKSQADTGLFAEVRSGRIGAPNPIYLIPGTSAPAAAWDDVRPILEQTYEVRSLSFAGFAGQPPQPWEGNLVEAQATALAAHLRETGVKDAVLIGHSLGGTVAMLTAMAAPDAVAKVVVVDSVPFLAQWLSNGAVQTLPQAQIMAAAVQSQLGAGDWEAQVARLKAGFAMQSRSEAFYPTLETWTRTSDRTTTAAALSDLLRLDLRERLSQLQQPTLVLMSYDPSFMSKSREEWLGTALQQYEALPHGQIALIEPSRHWIMHDQPGIFLAAVQQFLER